MNIALCVVLYNRRPAYSETLLSLSELCHKNLTFNIDIYIWNNGPEKIFTSDLEWIKEEFKGVEVHIVETPMNESLAHIYNSITELEGFDRYAFLDHDSDVQADYINAICSPSKFDLLVPKINAPNRQISPKYNGNIINKDFSLNDFSGKLRAITSGLVVSRNLVVIFKGAFGSVFDERYVLYGVDSSFFLRLDLCGRRKFLGVRVAGTIHHSLSRLEKEDFSVKKFRKHERGLDLGITLRNYFCLSSVLTLIRECVKTVLLRQTISWRGAIKGGVLGKHPRSKHDLPLDGDLCERKK